METQQQINALESRQLELRAIMAKSDARAAKCIKSGLDFRVTYPLDYEEYEAANAEYNGNEQTLAELRVRRAEELAAEDPIMNLQNQQR